MSTSKTSEATPAAQTEAAKNSRNFRTSTEVEKFYRFVNDNNLRREAKVVLKQVVRILSPKKKRKSRSKKVQ